jgi:hypothetical protein
MSLTLESLEASVMFFKGGQSLLNLLGYDSNSRAYHVFNMDSDCVETTYDVVLDKTNGSQVEQYNLDVVDDEEAP